MKILIYSIYFAPELTGVSKYTAEFVTWLHDQGHEVRVITAPPHYPNWKVFDGYSASHYTHESWGGAQVIRCPLWIPPELSGLKRIVYFTSFAASSLPPMIRQIFWKPDVVWLVAPTLMCAPTAALVGKLSGARSVLHIQDFEVDAAFSMGLLKGRFSRKLALSMEKWMLDRFDIVSTISRKMKELLLTKGVEERKTCLCPNWTDLAAIGPEERPREFSFRTELSISADATVALYSGNMGAKQGLELLSEAAKALAHRPDVVFIFCGNGPGKQELENECVGLGNVRFLDLQPLERFQALIETADIHLLPQRSEAADLVMPSKLTGMLASGRPVVTTAERGTELADVVSVCGLVVPPGDVPGFIQAIVTLSENQVLSDSLGKEGRRYAENHLDRDAVLSRYEKIISPLSSSANVSASVR